MMMSLRPRIKKAAEVTATAIRARTIRRKTPEWLPSSKVA